MNHDMKEKHYILSESTVAQNYCIRSQAVVILLLLRFFQFTRFKVQRFILQHFYQYTNSFASQLSSLLRTNYTMQQGILI